jgi:hypothetical protein
MKRIHLRTGLVGAALLLAACTIQVNTTVQPSGAGELRTEMGFNQADQEALSGVGASPEQFCADMQSDEGLGDEAPVTVEERGDEIWCVVTVPFADLAELRELYAGMGGITVNTLEVSGGEFAYEVQVEFAADQAEGMALADLSYRWQVTMPGRVSSNNADETDGSTLTWNVGLGETITAQATSSLSSGGGGLLDSTSGLGPVEWILIGLGLFFCCGLLVIVVGLAAYFIMRNRKKTPSAGAAPG